MKCKQCGSEDGKRMATVPPHGDNKKHKHCTEACQQWGWFCRNCRLWVPLTEH